MEETTKITIDEVKDFAFDVIGDMVDPKNITVIADDKKIVVLVGRSFIPRELIFDEWETKTKGTRFENVPVYVAP